MHKTLICGLALAAIFLAAAREAEAQQSPRRPNIVILLADDLGWANVGYHGGLIATPNIDRLATEGVRLERFYVCPVCSPTRGGLMTGRYPLRFGIMRTVIPPWCSWGLPPEEHTLAELLAEAGYERRGVIGKWHLGHSALKYHPLNQGFTHFYGHYNGAIDYFTHIREGELDWHRNMETCRDQGYSTDLIGREAVRFIKESPAAKPFFLYVPFNAPHGPFQAKEEDLAKYPHLKRPRKQYAAMVDSMDQAIGQILNALDDKGLADDSLVLFFSDNGGVAKVADNGPLKGAKATVYDGGIRVPAVIRWSNGIPGRRAVDAPMGFIDLYPTIRRIVGLTGADPNPLDGRDVFDVILGKAEAADRHWFSFIAMAESESIAVSTGTWKLVVQGASVLDKSTDAEQTVELFRIHTDPYETTDLAAENLHVVKDLLARLRQFRRLKVDGVGPYLEGRKGFTAPKDWKIPP